MKPFTTRLAFYEHLFQKRDLLSQRAQTLGKTLVPEHLRGAIGTSSGHSSLPSTVRRDILEAIDKGSKKVTPTKTLGDEIRRLVKSVYGDEYDAAPTNSCESALLISMESLFSPSSFGRGQPDRAKFIGLIERHAEHQLSYGRPFPPMYKDLFADRGATAGELGLLGRRLENTDVVMVPMQGARYELHGPKQHPANLLTHCDADATLSAVENAARLHQSQLVGFTSLGYDTPGYGYGKHDSDGTPVLVKGIASLAKRLGLPYVCDNAWGVPFLGVDPRKTGADIVLYSMDKLTSSPASGLIIGKELPMVSIRRALGIHSERFGSPSAHGKAAYVHADPGKLAMLGMIAALRALRDTPDRFKQPVDEVYVIVKDEFKKAAGRLPRGVEITKSYNLGGVEINIENTWQRNDSGIVQAGLPIFTLEDRIADVQLFSKTVQALGVLPGQAEDGNILITPGIGTLNDQGELIEENMRWAVRAVFESLILLNEIAQSE